VSVNVVPKTWELTVGADDKWRTKPPADNLAPTVPTNPVAQAVSSSLIRVSWTASTDSQSSVAYYIVERALTSGGSYSQVGTPATTTYDDASVLASTQYFYRVKAVDGSPLANTSAASSVVNATTPAGAALTWQTLTASYLPVIPGLVGFGMSTPGGSGRHLGTPATTVCIVNTLSNSRTVGSLFQANPPIYKCSLLYALRMSVPRVIVFEVSGVLDLQRTEIAIGRYMTYAGQTAPSPGFHIKNGSINAIGGDQVFWHHSNYNGDQASGQDSGARRNLSMGAAGTSNYVAAWCSGFWSSDQAFDCSVGGSNFTIVHCFAAEALCDSIHPKGQHGYGMLFENGVTNVSLYRTIIAHVIERDPLTRSPNAFIGNNLIYNSKGMNINMPSIPSAVGKGGYGMNPENYQGVTTQTNIEGNLFIKGPNFSSLYGGDKGIYLQVAPATFGILSGSRIYLASNHAIDFGTVTTQSDLYRTGGTLGANVMVSARISASFPEGMVVQDPKANGYAQLMTETCGARPGDRTAGRDATVAGHIMAKVNGAGDQGTGINTPPGGALTAANNTRDLLSSSAMNGDPLPNGSDRDTVQASGYTKLEEWLYRQHLAVM
jgi:hypothetical protein